MSMVVWVMMGIALWHFAVFVPDRFWGGIVGAFLTAIVGAAGAGMPPKAEEFRADHPFLWFIVERSSGLVLFAGRVTDPVPPT